MVQWKGKNRGYACITKAEKGYADNTDTLLSKREERECQQQKIDDELKKKHSDKKIYIPQLKL